MRRTISTGAWVAVVLVGATAAIGFGVSPVRAEEPRAIVGGDLVYRVEAGNPRLNRRVMGPVTRTIQGIPAEPVDSFVWDGDGSTPIEGEVALEINPVEDTGLIQAEWTDPVGNEWTLFQFVFRHPEHSSGVRLGPAVNVPDPVESFLNEGITHNVYLHGDTTAGMPILPTLFNHLATWGPADVRLNGEPFLNPFPVPPAPQWIAHLMVTEGVRHPDGTVRTTDGEIFNPMRKEEGAVQLGDLEVHLVFHPERSFFDPSDNVPPIFKFFYHLVFEDVRMEIVQADSLLQSAGGASAR